MNILIIGNGFDIASGLPTQYKDFLRMCFLAKNAVVSWANSNPVVSCLGLNREEQKDINEMCKLMGHDIYEKFKKRINTNFWLDHFYERKNIIGENWIDFEEEIRSMMMSVNDVKVRASDERIPYEIETIDKIIGQFCKARGLNKNGHTFYDLFSALLKEHKRLIEALEIYMDGYVNRKNAKMINYFKSRSMDKVLSFNYTCTYTENYSVELECCYIHGRADLDKDVCNLVLGFDDHYIEGAETIPELIPFEKYYQRIVNRNSSIYFEWLEEVEQSSDNTLYIFGHSLGASDGDVLRKFITCKGMKVVIFFRDEFDRAEKIKNLAIVLKPDNLIKLTSGTKPSIVFEKI